MKSLRLFTIVLLAILVISTWSPAPAYAKQPDTTSAASGSLTIDLAKTKLAKLRVDNHTGGTLYISLSGPKSYHFATSKQGKTIFQNIEPGKYTFTVTSSACGGKLTYKRTMKGTTSLKPVICKKK
jgi:hypothetical protein